MVAARVDPELVRRAQAGDRRALDALVAATYQSVYRLALGLCRSQADAEDLTQETFVRAVRALPGFRGDAAFETWLWSITLNVARSRWRRPPPEPVEPVEQPDTAADPAELAERAEKRLEVVAALLSLGEQSREILLLRDVQGLSNQEAAAVLGISPTAAKVRLFRAREQLAHLLDPSRDPSRRRR